MATLSAGNVAALNALAAQLSVEPIWSLASGDAGSDVNGWLGSVLADYAASPQLVALRQQVRINLGMNTTPDAGVMFRYYRALLDGTLPFPAGIVPAIWMDGNQPAYTDAAGTALVSVGSLVRRVNESSPRAGVWNSASDAQRPTRDAAGLRCDLNAAAGGASMIRTASGEITAANNCTLVCSYLARDNAFAGPQMGLFQISSGVVGMRIGGTAVWDCVGSAFSTLQVQQALRNTIAFRYTPTSVDVWVLSGGGAIQKQSFPGTYAATAVTGQWQLGATNGCNLYGSSPQAMAVNRQLTDAEMLSAMQWAHSQGGPDVPYPTSSALLVWVGDSIQRGTASNYEQIYPFLTLAAVRTAGKAAENCDVAVGGTGVTSLLDTSVLVPNNTLLRRGAAFYDPTRRTNIMVICLGTNDLANGNSVAYTLRGTAPPANFGSGLYPACDYARALGFKVVLMTIGPRSDAASITNGFNAARAIANADILANGHLHADAVVDTTQITHWGFDGDSNNATYYSADLIHPLNAAHALVAPAVTAAILSLM